MSCSAYSVLGLEFRIRGLGASKSSGSLAMYPISVSNGDIPIALCLAALLVNSANTNNWLHCSGDFSYNIYAFKNVSRVVFAFSA